MAYGKTPAGHSSYELLAGDVAALAPSPQTILDLACGDGYLLEILSRRFPNARLIGADMSAEELAAAQHRLNGRADLRLANARALPLDDGTCNAVTCHLAFMLMDDAAAVLTEAARILRRGGLFTAITNGGHTSDPIFAQFLRALRATEASEQLPPLTVGDPRTQDRTALSNLFEEEFELLTLDEEPLILDGTPAQVRAALLGFYNLARVSTNGRIQVAKALDEAILANTTPEGIVPLSLPIRHVAAIKR